MLKRASSLGGNAPCVGSVKKAGIGDAILRGSPEFKGSGRGGVQWEGTETYDEKQLTWRRINNADPTPKNIF